MAAHYRLRKSVAVSIVVLVIAIIAIVALAMNIQPTRPPAESTFRAKLASLGYDTPNYTFTQSGTTWEAKGPITYTARTVTLRCTLTFRFQEPDAILVAIGVNSGPEHIQKVGAQNPHSSAVQLLLIERFGAGCPE